MYAIPAIAQQIKRVEEVLGDRGRLLIRPSGTESKIRVMIEGEDESKITDFAQGLAEAIRKHLG